MSAVHDHALAAPASKSKRPTLPAGDAIRAAKLETISATSDEVTSEMFLALARLEDVQMPDALAEAVKAAAEYRPADRLLKQHEAELATLERCADCATSPALARTIMSAASVKIDTWEVCRDHSRGEVIAHTVGRESPHFEAADVAERVLDQVWQRWLRKLDEAAQDILKAPFDGPMDLLLRGQAFTNTLMGVTQANGLPENHEDVEILALAQRDALHEALDKSDDSENTWSEGLERYRAVEAVLTPLNQAWEEKWGSTIQVPADADPELQGQLSAAYAERDAARTLMLAGTPRTLSAILDMMEIVFDHVTGWDVGSYDVRARLAGSTPPKEEEMWNDKNDAHKRAIGRLAQHVARLRDRAMPRDWRDLMTSMERIHNGADAVRRAYELGHDVGCLTSIQLANAPIDQLPILTFENISRFPGQTSMRVGPDGEIRGEVIQ